MVLFSPSLPVNSQQCLSAMPGQLLQYNHYHIFCFNIVQLFKLKYGEIRCHLCITAGMTLVWICCPYSELRCIRLNRDTLYMVCHHTISIYVTRDECDGGSRQSFFLKRHNTETSKINYSGNVFTKFQSIKRWWTEWHTNTAIMKQWRQYSYKVVWLLKIFCFYCSCVVTADTFQWHILGQHEMIIWVPEDILSVGRSFKGTASGVWNLKSEVLLVFEFDKV